MPFDIEGARQAGYSDAEIADHLGKQQKYDVSGARQAGYSDSEILTHLTSEKPKMPAVKMGKEAFPEMLRKELQDAGWVGRNLAGAGTAISNVWEGAKQLVGAGDDQRVQANRIIAQEAPVGAIGGNIAMLAPTALIPGANTYAGAATIGAVTGALQPTVGDESRLANVAIGAGAGAAGKGIGDLAQKGLSAAKTKLLQEEIGNTVRDTTLEAAKKAGYVIPPADVSKSGVASALGGISGKIKTAQKASEMNQKVTNDLAKSAIGIPKDQPLTEEAIGAVRSEAGKAYEAIKSIPSRFKTDQQFSQDIQALGNDFSVAAQEFPEIAGNPAIESLKTALSKPDMSPKAAMELIKKLRFDAAKNYKSFDDPAKAYLGAAQKDAANAIEDLIERNLQGTGNEPMLDAFRSARELIAKTYSVESALTGGNVNASRLASQLSKGKPLSGELKTAAEFAQSFPKASQMLKEPTGATSPLDWALAMGTGNPLLIAARPGVRAALLSKPGQAMANPSYQPNALLRGAGNPVVNALFPSIATGTAIESRRK